MLGLKLPTDPRWVNLAEKQIDEILIDHAFCEQKAATSCITLIQSYPDKKELVKRLTPVVSEEWEHFRMVLEKLDEYGIPLGFQRKDEYVHGLMKFEKKGGSREDRLVERLLTCALIEARSCERFRLLSTELKDAELRKFYHGLMASEAGHYRMFLDLAVRYGLDKEQVLNRWSEFLEYEATLLQSMAPRGDRVH